MGTIQDDKDNPLQGVQIIEAGTSNIVYTDQKGAFLITLTKNKELIIKAKDRSPLNLRLVIDRQMEVMMIEGNGTFITTVNLKLLNDDSLPLEAEIGFVPKHPIKPSIVSGYPRYSPPTTNYETTTEKYLIKPAVTVEMEVAATYETVTKEVITQPASAKTISTPDGHGGVTETIVQCTPQYKTVTEQVLVKPASTVSIETPARYGTRTVLKSSEPTATIKTPVKATTAGSANDATNEPDLSDYTKMTQVVVSGGNSSRSSHNGKWKKADVKQKSKPSLPKPDFTQKPAPVPVPQKKRPAVAKAKILTATEVNDFSKWKFWEDIADDQLKEYSTKWGISTKQRYSVQVKSENGSPVIGGLVYLMDKNDKVLWTAKTDNTGKAELWGGFFQPEANGKKITVVFNGKAYPKKNIKTFHRGINIIELPIACEEVEKTIDIAFVVDATASMGDELNYVKSELLSIINQTKAELPDYSINLGSVFYYDEDTPGDLMYTKRFTDDVYDMNQFISQRRTKMGSNWPEALDYGLQKAVGLNWRPRATTKLLFLILDAPPHTKPEYYSRFQRAVELAASKGIRIIPVGCSGTNKTTEYLMRSVALATNGTYVHLTDDSGVGKPHTRPTVEKINKESLNDILIRQITKFSTIKGCEPDLEETIATIESEEERPPLRPNQVDWTFYPNPTSGVVNVNSSTAIKSIFVLDSNGKLLKRVVPISENSARLNIENFPSAVYLIRVMFKNGTQETGKIVLIGG